MKRPPVLFLLALAFGALALGVLWGTEIPLGVPGEWVWGRISLNRAELWDVVLGGLVCLSAGGLYCGLVWMGSKQIGNAGTLAVSVWLMCLTAAGFGWLILVQLSPPAGFGLSKSAWVLYYPGPSGYFDEARYRKESALDYLANYEKGHPKPRCETARAAPRHASAGVVSLLSGIDPVLRILAGFGEGRFKTQPPSVSAMFDEIERGSRRTGKPLQESDRAVIWLMTLITHLSGALVVVPLFFLAQHIASKPAAWTAAAFWPLVPALAIFLPKSDVLYALFGSLFLAVWLSGWKRRCSLRCFLAGILFWWGMLFSLAMLPVALLAALLVIWDLFVASDSDAETRSKDLKSAGWLILGAGAGFVLPVLLMWFSTDLNLFSVWWENYHNHAEFYQHFPRSYGAWLLVNPVETCFALGAPVVVMFFAAWITLWKGRKNLPREIWGPYVAFALVMGLLWITGKNRGEAARLWLVVFPYFLWLSARIWEPDPLAADPLRASPALPFLALQMIVCWFTVVRANGFPL